MEQVICEEAMNQSVGMKLKALEGLLSKMGSVLVAFSGGVDSTFLLKISHEVLKNRCLALTAVSASLPQSERLQCIQLSRDMGVQHILVESKELANPDYVKNPVNRCYYCKSELYRLCNTEASQRKIPWILDGFNMDDLKDYRPGFKAKGDYGVRSPLIEVQLSKEEIRHLSLKFGLSTWDKPPSPCLASRVPYGTEIRVETLGKVERLEEFLKQRGFRNFRLRYHDHTARLEVGESDFLKILSDPVRGEWIEECKKEGFVYVTLDLEGFRSGRLNEAAGIKVP